MRNNAIFLSCDWGTSAFRLRVVETAGSKVIAADSSQQGIAKTFELWRQSGQPEAGRLPFYIAVITASVNKLAQQIEGGVDGLPIVVSGMASSTIGMTDLPYKPLPFCIDGSDLEVRSLRGDDQFKHNMLVISGVRTADDVMRGEETKLVGCAAAAAGDALFILPGTHAKHVRVRDGKAIGFKTYMTGELFSLLSKKSILSASVEDGGELTFDNLKSFEQGVTDSTRENVLHSIFLVRTNNVFNKLNGQENYYYLSGLLIGTELKEIMQDDFNSLTIVSDAVLLPCYQAACRMLGPSRHYTLHIQNADNALVNGQVKMLSRIDGN